MAHRTAFPANTCKISSTIYKFSKLINKFHRPTRNKKKKTNIRIPSTSAIEVHITFAAYPLKNVIINLVHRQCHGQRPFVVDLEDVGQLVQQ